MAIFIPMSSHPNGWGLSGLLHHPAFPFYSRKGNQLPQVRAGQACGAVQTREPAELRVTEEGPLRLGWGGDGGGGKAGSPPGRGREMVLSWVIVVATALGH